MKRKYTRIPKVDQGHFDSVKLMSNSNIPVSLIARTLHLGRSTVNFLVQSSSLEDYRLRTAARSRSRAQTPPTSTEVQEAEGKLDKIYGVLIRIENHMRYQNTVLDRLEGRARAEEPKVNPEKSGLRWPTLGA